MSTITQTSTSRSGPPDASDYASLTKPGILRLLVLTAFCTMLVAAGGLPEWSTMIWTLIGTALICGSANTINMVWDRDIDP